MAKKSVIPRYSDEECKIQREQVPNKIRDENEVSAVYAQVGYSPERHTKSWYSDVYKLFNNEY